MFVWISVVEVSGWSVDEILTELGVSNRNRVKREKVTFWFFHILTI